MVKKLSVFYRYRGFAILSLTLILLVVSFTISLPAALLEYKRIHRTNLLLLHQQSKVKAAVELDLFYFALYETPTLLTLASNCPIDFHTDQIFVPAVVSQKYQLFDEMYLCKQSSSQFDMAVRLKHGTNIEDVIARRKLHFVDGKLSWINDSFIDY